MSISRMVYTGTSYFGEYARNEIKTEIAKHHFKKAFLISDKDLMNCGIVGKVESVLKENQTPYEIDVEVKPNPTIENVTYGLERYQESGSDFIVAVGGGSVIDTAKAIAVIANNPENADVVSLEGMDKSSNPAVPMIALPTTAGTGSETTMDYVITNTKERRKMACMDSKVVPVAAILDTEIMASLPLKLTAATAMDALTHAVESYLSLGAFSFGFAVLTNPENGDKKSLRCNAIVANASIIDSECMMTMPRGILANVGFDALCHCMEAYISKISQPMTDMMCEKGMELLGKYLIPLYEGACEPEAWDAVSLASTIGGMVIHTAGVTLAHGMEHPASGLRDITHGKGLAAITPAVMEASAAGCLEKFAVISRCLGGKDEKDCVDRIRKLIEQLNLTVTLGELGIKEEDVAWMAENCMKVSAAGISYHPVTFDRDQIEELYRRCL